jgi:hypothetical protein
VTPEELRAGARAVMAAECERMTLVIPRGWKRPPKFPRGELLCENSDGENVYSFDPRRILAWVDGVIERERRKVG